MSTIKARAPYGIPLLGVLLLTGCAAFKGYPTRYSEVDADLKTLSGIFAQQKLIDCEVAKDTGCRDLIINSLVRAIDLRYHEFRQSLFESSGALNVASETAVLGLSAAGALLAPARTKAILAGISGVVTGANASVDKNLLFDKTVNVLLERMDVLRKEKLLDITKGLSLDWAGYTLATGLVDVESYYSAGTIPAAANSISAQTGEKNAKVDKETKEEKQKLYE